MSEDVDVLLFGNLSRKQRDESLRKIAANASAHLGLNGNLEREELGRKLTSRFSYADHPMNVGSAGVMLELGFRGHPEPSQKVQMTSYLAEYIDSREDKADITYQELLPVELDVLAPERTLLEKIFALHCAASTFERGSEDLRIITRYYYDIKLLLDNDGVRSGLSAFGDLEEYSQNELLNATIGQPFSGPARPIGGYAESRAFNPTQEMMLGQL